MALSPIWSSSGSAEIATPPNAYVEEGFKSTSPPSIQYLNWILNALTTAINDVESMFLVEHKTNGKHSDVHADTIAVGSGFPGTGATIYGDGDIRTKGELEHKAAKHAWILGSFPLRWIAAACQGGTGFGLSLEAIGLENGPGGDPITALTTSHAVTADGAWVPVHFPAGARITTLRTIGAVVGGDGTDRSGKVGFRLWKADKTILRGASGANNGALSVGSGDQVIDDVYQSFTDYHDTDVGLILSEPSANHIAVNYQTVEDEYYYVELVIHHFTAGSVKHLALVKCEIGYEVTGPGRY